MSFVLIAAGEIRETFNLTTDMQTYSLTFKYEGAATSGKLDFEFGNISASSVVAMVTMDNIQVFKNFNPLPEERTDDPL